MSKMTKAQKQERQEAIDKLRTMLSPGDNVYTSVSHVSSSGMQRSIKLYRVDPVGERDDGKPTIEDITWLVGRALDYRHDSKHGGLKVGGCGMDMCFHLVYSLGRTLWPEGGPLDKNNGTRRFQAEREGVKIERDGGYLLTKRDL